MSAQPSNAPAATDAASYLDLGITIALNNWPALTLAVQSNWGGPTSEDKRAWLGGAISDILAERPETDADDIEDILIQVMNDEFEVAVDDESAANIADEIMEMKQQTERGEFANIQALWEAWQSKSQQRSAAANMFKQVEADDQETDGEDDDVDMDVDMDMDEAPELVRAPREEPEVDEDGFTKVVGKKRR